ncbi:MAG: hypothetical protein FWG90_03480 [Oscillospiraceae bacterium]|nr:hypothetical protein [Oscillospiraceae bacterium]
MGVTIKKFNKRKKRITYKVIPEEQDKIELLKTEIEQLKRENYEFYQNPFGEELPPKEPFKVDVKTPVFLLGAALFAAGVFKLFSLFEFEKSLYIGNRIIPQQLSAIPFIAGFFMLYFVKEKSAAITVMIFGAAVAAGVFMISGSPHFTGATVFGWFFILTSIISGAAVCGVMLRMSKSIDD